MLLPLLALALVTQGGTPAGAAARTEEAERLAGEAIRRAASDPKGALDRARRALELTTEFEPTAFVTAGRKGEVVEDEFQAARDGYRQHRARLYEAVGALLARQGRALPASRYLGRAFLLDPTPDRGLALARALIALGRGREALATTQRAIAGLSSLSPEAAGVIAAAADAAGLPSAQAEIDRGRLKATLGDAITLREGPITLPPGARLSTTPVVRLEDAAVTLVYASEGSCRTCSADLEAVKRAVKPGVRVLALPPSDEQDVALRQVLGLYRYDWPLLLGRGVSAHLGLEPRSVLLVARGGWSGVVLNAPFGPPLAAALDALGRADVAETVPRPGWNRRPVDRSPLPPPPGLLREGLAPGEDLPAPPEFDAAVAAFRAGKPALALRLFEELAARGDGWLLPPELRLNRAMCLAEQGQRDVARRLLLRTGDSRFEDAIDRALEAVAAPRR